LLVTTFMACSEARSTPRRHDGAQTGRSANVGVTPRLTRGGRARAPQRLMRLARGRRRAQPAVRRLVAVNRSTPVSLL
jgi:hypothetical protein